MSKKIAEWAEWGIHIPLKCQGCGALFSTKNIGRVGDRSVFFGFNGQGKEEASNCKCSFDLLKPDQATWNNFNK